MLIDDESIALKELQFHLDCIEGIEIVCAFTNPFEGFFHIPILNPQVIFLDIDMPEISGIYLAEQITNKYPNTRMVFVTAYNEYAINAFELNAVDYVLKPVALDRIKKSVERVLDDKEKSMDKNIHTLSEQYEESVKKIFVQDNDDLVLLNFNDILYIEAFNKFVRIRTKDKFYHANYSLSYYENKLQNLNFFRAHRSYLVNLDKIIKIVTRVNYTYDIQIKDSQEFIPASRNNIKLLRKLLEY